MTIRGSDRVKTTGFTKEVFWRELYDEMECE